VVNVATILLGPLVGPECRRAVARGWLILVRALAALAIMGSAFIVVWYWWINQQMDMEYQPYYELRVGLVAIEGMAVTIALLMAPAVLAGSIAGEKSRGSMGLLLTTRVSPREIIAARLTGKLTQVAMILLAGAPGLVLIAALAGFEAPALALLAALPAAVAIGGGGIAILASTVVRRGRDALLAVYLLDFLFLLTPLSNYFGLPIEFSEWFSALDPFSSLYRLTFRDEWMPALLTSAIWLSMGLASAGLASWRLRPACLALIDGERVAKRTRRRWRVPPLGDRPMLWKELYIERAASLGGIGRWFGLLAVVLLAGGSLTLAGVILWDLFVNVGTTWADWATGVLAIAIDAPALYVSWLIQWAIGLRAAATISSERERGTWDALLTSPLSGREIIWGKVWGSLFALRWVVLATLVAWTVAVVAGAMPLREYIRQVATTLILGAYMAAVGVRTSLSSATATRSMSLTIGAWLLGWVVIAIVAIGIISIAALVWSFFWAMCIQLGLVPSIGTSWFPTSFSVAWPVTTLSLFALSVVAIVGDTSLRFDRIAGRLTEGKVAGAVDRIVYGPAMEPVAVGADGRLMEPAVTIDQGREEPVSRPS
jgi:ABC-type transport system involved in multi-copper enzyme maturation permease subunit